MDDGQIIELFWARDENAIRETSSRYGAYCRAVAGNILHSPEDTAEVLNDTWMKAWDAIPPQRPRCLKLFLARIARNLAFNRYRAGTAAKRGGGETAAVLEELSECLADSSDAESAYSGEALEESVRQFVRELPERDANVFVRRYFFTESVAGIAERFGFTENNVSVILSRLRRKLKKRLKQEGYPV